MMPVDISGDLLLFFQRVHASTSRDTGWPPGPQWPCAHEHWACRLLTGRGGRMDPAALPPAPTFPCSRGIPPWAWAGDPVTMREPDTFKKERAASCFSVFQESPDSSLLLSGHRRTYATGPGGAGARACRFSRAKSSVLRILSIG